MGVKVKTPSQQQINELRQLFEEKYAETPPTREYNVFLLFNKL